MNNTKKNKFKLYIIAIVVISLLTTIDQLTKSMIAGKFTVQQSKTIIKDVFSITYVQNRGIAWSMLEGQKILFIIVTIIILGLCVYIYNNTINKSNFKLFRICLIVLASGAIGNMIDRISLGYVIDFFSFDLINFPVFNVADIYVVCSMIVLLILTLFKYNDEELSALFKKTDK